MPREAYLAGWGNVGEGLSLYTSSYPSLQHAQDNSTLQRGYLMLMILSGHPDLLMSTKLNHRSGNVSDTFVRGPTYWADWALGHSTYRSG